MQLLMYRPSTSAVWADALFAAPGSEEGVTGDGWGYVYPACADEGW
jgi:hypothetical protein